MTIKAVIKKTFDEFSLDISFESQSSRIGILGASGCGKSMTLKSIAGIEEIDQGYIEVNGKVFTDTGKKVYIKPQKRKVGYVFQNYALFPAQTVAENIMAGMHGKCKKEKIKITTEIMAKFQLTGLEGRLPGELSGGQQQRVALARLMVYEPEIILLDEPFSALDGFLKERLQQEMMEMLKDFKGIVILVSHDRDEIYRFSDELLIMEKGKFVSSGKTEEIFKQPQKVEAAKLIGCKNIVSVKVLDSHSFAIEEWDTIIYCEHPLPEKLEYIGYRAHDFEPWWDDETKNCIPCRIKSIARLPFEDRYYLESKGEEICWFVQKGLLEKRIQMTEPQFLKVCEEKLLFLVK